MSSLLLEIEDKRRLQPAQTGEKVWELSRIPLVAELLVVGVEKKEVGDMVCRSRLMMRGDSK